MKLKVKNIGFSIKLGLLLSLSSPVLASTVDRVDTIVVTASGYAQKSTNAAASISVITAQDLSERKFNDLAEALSDVEGVDVRSSIGKTGGLDISIRGMPSEYTLILVDGIRQTGSSDVTPNGFGTMNTSFMPPLNSIERIEVIRGPMSTLYGSDAMGGVVNIITKKVSNEWHSSLTAEHALQQDSKFGDMSRLSLYTSGALVEDVLGIALRGNVFHRQASEAESSNQNMTLNKKGPNPVKASNFSLGGKLTWTPTTENTLWLDVDIARQKYDNDKGQLGSLGDGTSGGRGGYEKTLRYERNKFVLGSDNQLSFGQWNSSLTYNQVDNKGRLITKSSVPVGSSEIGEQRKLKNENIIFDTTFVMPVTDDHLVTAGGQYWYATMKDGIVLANSGDKFSQKSWSLFAEDEWQLLDPLAFTYGARYEHHETFGGHLSPRGYLVWSVNEDWTVKGGVSTGYKTPSLAELHDGVSGVTGQGTILTIGNPNLKPEKSVSHEVGVYYKNDFGFNANATLFYNRYKDKISSKTIDATTSTYTNVGKATTQGLEFGTTVPMGHKDVTLNLNYTYTESEQKDGKNRGASLTNTPKHMVNARLNWKATDQLTTWLKVEYRAKMARFTENYDQLSAVNKTVYDDLGPYFNSYTVASLGGAYRFTPNFTLSASINNLFDKDFTKTYVYTVGSNSTTAGEYFSSSNVTKGSVIQGRSLWLVANITF